MPPKIIGNQMQMGQLNSFVLVQQQDGSWTITGATTINGLTTINAATGAINLVVQTGDASNASLRLVNSNGIWHIRHTSTGDFKIIEPTSSNEVVTIEKNAPANTLYIDSTGKIGLGIANPGNSLTIQSSTDPIIELITTNGAGRSFWIHGRAAGGVGNFGVFDNTAGAYRIFVDANGNVGFGPTSFGANAAGVISVKNGTAPTTGPADTVQFYSSDDAAGHTIPSFYCEGTNVVATGQADIASSVRVKIRINGTVRTFLCI